MKNYNCIIIDDEELARNLLENFISRVPHLRLLAKFSNPVEAISCIREEAVDVIFLDIQMPEMTGIEFMKTLSKAPAVIFTTAYKRYALEGYELSVIDYLLKPFSFSRFLNAVNKATELLELRSKESVPVKSANNSTAPEFLLINADHKLHRLFVKDILYIQSMKEYVIYFSEQGKIMALGSLKSLEEKLPASDFIRIHKSYIVAKSRVKSLDGNQLNIGEIKLPIGGSYKSDVMENLFGGDDKI